MDTWSRNQPPEAIVENTVAKAKSFRQGRNQAKVAMQSLVEALAEFEPEFQIEREQLIKTEGTQFEPAADHGKAVALDPPSAH